MNYCQFYDANVSNVYGYSPCFRPSMSQGTVIHQRLFDKDFTVGTPEEFVRRFKGTKVINKVSLGSEVKVIEVLSNVTSREL